MILLFREKKNNSDWKNFRLGSFDSIVSHVYRLFCKKFVPIWLDSFQWDSKKDNWMPNKIQS